MLEKVIAEHLEDRVDVQAVSRTCHALHSLTSSPALEAAWLWRWRGNQALFQTPIRLAVLRQLVEVHHADVNTAQFNLGASLLHLTCSTDEADTVTYLTSTPGIDVNLACGPCGVVPLHLACMAGSVRSLRQLLALPQIQVNATASQGFSSLHLACTLQKVEVVEELLRHPDIDVNLMTTADVAQSPLALAADKGDTVIVAMLLRQPAIQVNAAGAQGGLSPLFLATSNGHAGVVRELLRHPDIRMSGNDGLTHLYNACMLGHLSVIRELLGHPGLEAGSILAVLAEAEAIGKAAVVALLKGHRAVRRAMGGRGRA